MATNTAKGIHWQHLPPARCCPACRWVEQVSLVKIGSAKAALQDSLRTAKLLDEKGRGATPYAQMPEGRPIRLHTCSSRHVLARRPNPSSRGPKGE